jgi:hypothetical protein
MTEPAKKIRIRLKGVTAHVAGPAHAPRFETFSGCTVQTGHLDVRQIPPGQVFECEEAEGRRLVARFGGEVVEDGGAP